MKQGEIWLINLDQTIGAKIRKTRPRLILNKDLMGKLPLKVIVPITDRKNPLSGRAVDGRFEAGFPEPPKQSVSS